MSEPAVSLSCVVSSTFFGTGFPGAHRQPSLCLCPAPDQALAAGAGVGSPPSVLQVRCGVTVQAQLTDGPLPLPWSLCQGASAGQLKR